VTLKLGFIVNPIAGLGGKKAWKGTDFIDEAWSFFENGEHYSFGRVKTAIESIPDSIPLLIHHCGNPMGEEIISLFPFERIKIYDPEGDRSTAEDTKNACKAFIDARVDLILFVGGDGTARDVASVIGDKIPVLGIPSGVKMYSGCFLYRPQDLGEIIEEMYFGDITFAPEDVMDVNEALFRENKVQSSLFGHLLVPQILGLIQGGKVSSSFTSIETYESMAEELKSVYDVHNGTVILGTGSTVFHVLKSIGIEKTLLGIDVLENGQIMYRDVNEETLYDVVKGKDVRIVLTPIGGQGFVLGRGNQQISARVINSVKSLKLVIVSTEEKLQTIDQLELDLNDPIEIKDIKNGYIRVLVEYHQYKLTKINVKSLN